MPNSPDDPQYGPEQKALPEPYAYVQWKGMDACLDINCSCGELTHLDAETPYGVRCTACKRVWRLGYYVPLLLADEGLWKIQESTE